MFLLVILSMYPRVSSVGRQKESVKDRSFCFIAYFVLPALDIRKAEFAL
jgi:hypothetical protein